MTRRLKKRKSKKPLPPRRLRMRRDGRLRAAPRFLASYRGKNVVRGYSRWFGVDLGCALVELQMLGVELDRVYVDSLRVTLREIERIGRERNERRRRAREEAEAAAAIDDLEFASFFDDYVFDALDPPF